MTTNKMTSSSRLRVLLVTIAISMMLCTCAGYSIWKIIVPSPVAGRLSLGTPLCGTWESRSSSVVGSGGQGVRSVDVLSDDEAWTVGTQKRTLAMFSLGEESGMIMHWDGSGWHSSWASNPGSSLTAVKALSRNDVWAVGSSYTNTLALRWNGFAWSIYSTPDPGQLSNLLSAVDAFASDDAWAVGYSELGRGVIEALILHWNGQSWIPIHLPEPLQKNALLTGLSVGGKDDVWAVGATTNGIHSQPLILHWDGVAWQRTDVPETLTDGRLSDVKAISSDDVWAIGTSSSQALLMHWEGSTWHVVPVRSLPNFVDLTDVDAISSDDVWTVGYSFAGVMKPLVLHWNGSDWSIIPTAQVRHEQSYRAVAVMAMGQVWAFGNSFDDEDGVYYDFESTFSKSSCLNAAIK